MPWGKCDDGFYDHPKVKAMPVEIRNAASGLFWRAVSLSNRLLSDGRLRQVDVFETLDGTPQQAQALASVRLWHVSGKGFRIHDFADFNFTRKEVIADRKQRSELGRLGGLASAASRRNRANQNATDGQPDGQPDGSLPVEPPSRPVPSRPVPVDSRDSPGFPRRDARPFPDGRTNPFNQPAIDDDDRERSSATSQAAERV